MFYGFNKMTDPKSIPQAQAEPMPINVVGVVVNDNPTREMATTDKMVRCYNLRRTVKILCGIDIFFGILYSWYYPIFFISTIIAIGGYYGAKHYNSCMVLSYFIIIMLDWISKLCFYIYIYSTDDNLPSSSWFLIALNTIINIWISKIVYKYWKCLKEISDIELNRLKQLQLANNRFIYW